MPLSKITQIYAYDAVANSSQNLCQTEITSPNVFQHITCASSLTPFLEASLQESSIILLPLWWLLSWAVEQ